MGWWGSTKSEPCHYGLNCKRPGCWHFHPERRGIDQNPNIGDCKFGPRWKWTDCFYRHPEVVDLEGAQVAALETQNENFVPHLADKQPRVVYPEEALETQRQDFVLHLDELMMPYRPEAQPSPSDREVWVNPMPRFSNTSELNSRFSAFGEVEDLYVIPGKRRGYVRYCDHMDAQKCVDAKVGTWSESERAVQELIPNIVPSYPDTIVGYFLGRRAGHLHEFMTQIGVNNLRLNTSAQKKTNGDSTRVHFSGRATPLQFIELKLVLEILLSSIHDKISRLLKTESEQLLVTGFPPNWATAKVSQLFCAFGDLASISVLEGGSATVTFHDIDDAVSAQLALDGYNTGGKDGIDEEPLCQRLHVKFAPPKVPDGHLGESEKCATIFIGNMPLGVGATELKHILEQVGPVGDVRPMADASFAFADFVHPSDAPKALRTLKKTNFRGTPIELDWCGKMLVQIGDKANGPTDAEQTSFASNRERAPQSEQKQREQAWQSQQQWEMAPSTPPSMVPSIPPLSEHGHKRPLTPSTPHAPKAPRILEKANFRGTPIELDWCGKMMVQSPDKANGPTDAEQTSFASNRERTPQSEQKQREQAWQSQQQWEMAPSTPPPMVPSIPPLSEHGQKRPRAPSTPPLTVATTPPGSCQEAEHGQKRPRAPSTPPLTVSTTPPGSCREAEQGQKRPRAPSTPPLMVSTTPPGSWQEAEHGTKRRKPPSTPPSKPQPFPPGSWQESAKSNLPNLPMLPPNLPNRIEVKPTKKRQMMPPFPPPSSKSSKKQNKCKRGS